MKRSEMVNRISDNVLSSFFPDMTLNAKNLIADFMLTECEKMGMLPPLNTEGHWADSRDYNWEPENK